MSKYGRRWEEHRRLRVRLAQLFEQMAKHARAGAWKKLDELSVTAARTRALIDSLEQQMDNEPD